MIIKLPHNTSIHYSLRGISIEPAVGMFSCTGSGLQHLGSECLTVIECRTCRVKVNMVECLIVKRFDGYSFCGLG